MRLEGHPSLVAAVIAVVFTAAGGSIQAGATSRAVTHAERSSAAGATRTATGPNPRGSFGSALLGSAPVAVGHWGSFGSALVGSVPVPPGPAGVAVDTATDTIYVVSGDNNDGTSLTHPPNTVAVINGRHCEGVDVSRCKGPWPTVKVGEDPGWVTVDQATDTIYVTNVAANTVSVIDGATCNAEVTSGCGQKPATVPVGSGPFGLFADSANQTVYVANFVDNTVSMIDSATCTGSNLAACPSKPPPTVAVGFGPGDVDVNQVTHSAYVSFGNGVTVFDTDTCNASILFGCADTGTAVIENLNRCNNCGGFAAQVDPDNNTIYTADGEDNTVSVIDGRTCDAADLAGCAAETPATVTVGPPLGFETAVWLTVDPSLHTVYAVNQNDDDLSVINTNLCDGSHMSGCSTLQPPTIHTGVDPEAVDLDSVTQTLYTANQVSNDVSVINALVCNATITSGCRQPPPSVGLVVTGAPAADPAVGTLYVPTDNAASVSMIDSRTCNARRRDGCTSTPPTVTVGAYPQGVAIDPTTHTVYVANYGVGATASVSMFDATTCNATTPKGCGKVQTLQVPGGNAVAIATDPVTDTVYVVTEPPSGPNTVSVFNAATCNATHSTGCTQVPHSATVGPGSAFDALAVDTTTDTIYVANTSLSSAFDQSGNTVSVIDGATCNAANTTGCSKASKTITLGPTGTGPRAVAVDEANDTIYVADAYGGDYPMTTATRQHGVAGTVSVINGATCNATVSTGCSQTPPSVAVGRSPIGIAFDGSDHTVVTTNLYDTSDSLIDAATCNAIVTTSCNRIQKSLAVGRGPFALAIDPTVGTIYTMNADYTVSILPAGS